MGIFHFFQKKAAANSVPALDPGEKMVIFQALGMHWVSCQASVEAELHHLAGVRHFEVDVKKQSATVIYDPSKTELNDLREAIHRAGYTPRSENVIEG